MIPAPVTPFHLLLRRITFISCTCIIIAGCIGVRRKHAAIQLRADTADTTYIHFDCNRRYDTTGATFSVIMKTAHGKPLQELPVQLYSNGKLVRQMLSNTTNIDFGWVIPGEYTLTAGHQNEYPYFVITGIMVTSGAGCQLELKFPEVK